MKCSFNVRLLVAFVAVSFLGVGFAHAVYKDCQKGTKTTTIVESEVLNPNSGDAAVTRVTTVVNADDACVAVEYSKNCTLFIQAFGRRSEKTETFTRHQDGSTTPPVDEGTILSGNRNKCS